MWNDLAAEIEHLDVARDPRIILRDPNGKTVVFGKYASSKIEIGYFYPFLESGPSGKREVVYHAIDQELGFDLTGRTVLARLNGGEKVSLAKLHEGALTGVEARYELERANHVIELENFIEANRRDWEPALMAQFEHALESQKEALLLNPVSNARILKTPSAAFQKMGLLDMVLGQTDRNNGNWMVDEAGNLKAIDNARVLGIRMRFDPFNTHTHIATPKGVLGEVDPEAKAKLLALTPERLAAILTEHKIPAVYRYFADRNLRNIQRLLRANATFETISAESAKLSVNDYIPMAIAVGGAGGAVAGTFYFVKD